MKSLKTRAPREYVGEPELQATAVSVVVPPERALLPVDVVVTHQSYSQTASELRRARAEITGLLGPHATLRTKDYSAPTSHEGSTYRGLINLEVEVDLRGLADVDARMDRLDAVLGRVLQEIHHEAPVRKKWSPKTSAAPQHGNLWFDVYDLPSHRPALLSKLAERLAGLPGASDSPQWRPAELACVSNGEISVRGRKLSGITLQLDLGFALWPRPSGDA